MTHEQVRAFTFYATGLARELRCPVLVSDSFKTKIQAGRNELTDNVKCSSVWDTGATNSVISERIVDAMNLPIISETEIIGANGPFNTTIHVVDLWLPNHIVIPRLQVSKGVLADEDVLIGMDVITMGDFAVSNYEGKTIFTYRVPSLAVTDYVKLLQSVTPAKSVKIGRNELCPCGSGRKYKNCHGKQ